MTNNPNAGRLSHVKMRFSTNRRFMFLLFLVFTILSACVTMALADETASDIDETISIEHGDSLLKSTTAREEPEHSLLSSSANGSFSHKTRISSIDVAIDPIYPPENNKLPHAVYRLINAIHFRTSPSVIRREFLFHIGDELNTKLLEETERNLRRFRCFRKVSITSKIDADGEAVVDVHTIDSWTTKLIADLSRQGGQYQGAFGIREDNLLGRGKQLSLYYADDAVRETVTMSYNDPRLFGKFLTMSTRFATAEDLEERSFTLSRPFTSLMTTSAAETTLSSRRATVYLYQAGDDVFRFTQKEENISMVLGYSPHPSEDSVFRIRTGFRYARDRFETADDSRGRPYVLPETYEERLFSGLFAGIEIGRIDYIKEFNITTYGRDEDYDLGPKLYVELGVYPEFLGSRHNALIPGFSSSIGMRFSPGHFMLMSVSASGRNENDGWKNVVGSASQEYYLRIVPRFTLSQRLQIDARYRSDPDRQLLLGGGQGLEAYALNYFSGNKRALLQVQARILLIDDLLKLCTIGGLIFADAGNVWPEGDPMTTHELNGDAGLGFRITFPRSSTGSVVKFTYARAFTENGLDDRWLISFVSTRGF